MNHRRSLTRQLFIETADTLFCAHGFHAVGLDQIIAQSKLTKTTFYNHFESKDDLILAAIKKRDVWWRQVFQDEIARRAGPDPVTRLRSVFGFLRDFFERHEFHGCMFISAATQFPAPSDPAHIAAKANVNAIRDLIADMADNAGIVNPARFAQKFNLIIEGAFVIEVVDQTFGATADAAAELANTLIDHALAESTATSFQPQSVRS